jgi:hypothetical protein
VVEQLVREGADPVIGTVMPLGPGHPYAWKSVEQVVCAAAVTCRQQIIPCKGSNMSQNCSVMHPVLTICIHLFRLPRNGIAEWHNPKRNDENLGPVYKGLSKRSMDIMHQITAAGRQELRELQKRLT